MSRLINADELEPDTEWSEYYDGFTSYSQSQINGAVEVQAIIIPEGATNGDMIEAMFPNAKTWEVTRDDVHCACIEFKDICEIKSFPLSWWNAPYKEVEECTKVQ